MTAWLVDHAGPVERLEVVSTARKLMGPYKASLDVRFKFHESEFTLTYELRAGDPQVYLHLTGTWFQRGTPATGVPVLRMAFPFALKNAQARYEIPFGAVDRDLNEGQEVPALQWAQVSGDAGDQRAGCLLLNDSKHGHSLDGSTLRLTLIRASCDPDPLPEIGQHEIHAALRPFGGEIPVSQVIRIARNFNHSVRVVGTDIHKGPLPASAGLVTVHDEDVILSSIKKAEDRNALVFTLFNPTDKDCRPRLAPNLNLLGAVASAVEVDLIERPVQESSATARGNMVSVSVPARGIASVMIQLKRPARGKKA